MILPNKKIKYDKDNDISLKLIINDIIKNSDCSMSEITEIKKIVLKHKT